MPFFMDRHEGLEGITPKEAAENHMRDLEVHGRYGVRYLTYWLDPQRGTVFCLAEAPSAEAAEKVHRESHGQVPPRSSRWTSGWSSPSSATSTNPPWVSYGRRPPSGLLPLLTFRGRRV